MALKLIIFLVASFLLITSEKAFTSTSSIAEPHHDAAPPPTTAEPPLPKIVYVDVAECPSLCLVRCAKHSRPNHCHRACGTCCARCKCVPPGTYGNREMCGKCYTDMTTHHNRTKCP